MITYRKANPEDIQPAIALWLKIWDEFIDPEKASVNPDYDELARSSNLLKKYESSDRVMLVAADGERIVGAIGAVINENFIKPPLCVDREYHRQGIATELLSRMVCELKMQGSEVIKLNSSRYALPFYENFGFVQTGPEQKLESFDVAYIPMEYSLSAMTQDNSIQTLPDNIASTIFCDITSEINTPVLRQILSFCLGDNSPEGVDKAIIKYPGKVFNGWFEDDEPMGICGFLILQDKVEICHIAVTPNTRRKGIGRAMVLKLREKYGKTIDAETDDEAVGFYRKCGFATIELYREYDNQRYRRWTCTLC